MEQPMGRVRYEGEWVPYVIAPPPRMALVKFWYELSDRQWVGRACDLEQWAWPACDLNSRTIYLWYKLTGIERMRDGERESL